jgi:hypothetical protein
MLARVEEVVKLLLELLLHVNSDGKCAIFSHPDKFKEIATTELTSANKKVYEIFALEQGYCPVVQKDICTEKDVANYKQKPAEKLLKLLARFYVAVWHSWLHRQTRFMVSNHLLIHFFNGNSNHLSGYTTFPDTTFADPIFADGKLYSEKY